MRYIKTFEQHSVKTNEEIEFLNKMFGKKATQGGKEFVIDGKELPDLKKKYATVLDKDGASISKPSETNLCTIQEGKPTLGIKTFNGLKSKFISKLGMDEQEALEATLKVYNWNGWTPMDEEETKYDKGTKKLSYVRAASTSKSGFNVS